MASASWALQQAIHQTLTTNATLMALLGGPHVFDHVPRGASSPYVTFGVSSVRDWSAGSEDGGEHIVTLQVWSKAAGRKEAEGIAEALRAALHDQAPALAGHHLVNLRHELTEIRREPDNEMYRGIVRLRAVTEKGG